MQKSAEQDSIDNAEGLGKLDAGNLADDRSIEQKIEEVAQAMGLEDSPKVQHGWSDMPRQAAALQQL